MRARAGIGWVFLLGTLACAPAERGLPIAEAGGAAAGYDLLLITLDTTRADRLGCYGRAEARTPTLDAIAASGVLVADAVTVAPVTLPAHASILTGLYPATHGVRDNGEFSLPAETWTLAQELSASGYATAAFVSAFVLDARFGLGTGFDLYDDRVGAAPGEVALVDHANERDARAVTDAALAWLDELGEGEPFFAWVHYFDPHQPYTSPEVEGGVPPSDPSRAYDAEIAHVDTQIARLLAALEASGRRGRTLVAVVADHGEGLGEHDEATHSLLIYGSTMRVPLLFAAPGALAPGQRLEDTVASVVDVAPTLLDLLGVAATAPPEGRSLAAPLDPDRIVFQETLVPWLDHGWSPLHAARRHRDKLVRAPVPEYYDLRADPGETDNRYEAPAAATGRDRLREELERRLASVSGDPATPTPLDAEAAARLESLGYASSGGEAPGDGTIDPKAMMPAVRRLDESKALAAAGRFDEALARIEGLETEVGESRTLLGELARIYARVGREADAAAALERYLAIRPSTQALVMLAQIQIRQGDLDAAERHLDAAFALDPQHGAVHIARGDIALARGDEEAARAHYLEAGRVDPYRARLAMQNRLTMLRARRAREG